MTPFEKIDKLIKENNEVAVPLMRKLGLTPQIYSNWKRGKASPSTDAIVKIAEYFNVSTDYILTEKETANEIKSLSPTEQTMLNCFRGLKTSEQSECIDFCNYLLSKHK